MEQSNNIIDISGLWRNRFYSGLQNVSEPVLSGLLESIEYCRREEVKGGEFAEDAANNLAAYMEALELLFPDTYNDLLGTGDA